MSLTARVRMYPQKFLRRQLGDIRLESFAFRSRTLKKKKVYPSPQLLVCKYMVVFWVPWGFILHARTIIMVAHQLTNSSIQLAHILGTQEFNPCIPKRPLLRTELGGRWDFTVPPQTILDHPPRNQQSALPLLTCQPFTQVWLNSDPHVCQTVIYWAILPILVNWVLFLLFWNRLYVGPTTHYVEQTDLEPTDICLPTSPSLVRGLKVCGIFKNKITL